VFLGFTGILPFLGVIPARIAERKGRNGFGWWLYGTTLFIVALPHALMLKDPDEDVISSPEFRPCPFCGKTIHIDVTRCAFCKRDVPRVEILDEYASTAFLIQNLGARDTMTREQAIILLGDRGPSEKEALPRLRAMLDDPSRRVRIRAAWALQRIGE
jgi:hypothetical protein